MTAVQEGSRARRLGMIAPEFPPDLGGMAELAGGLAQALAASWELDLFTLPRRGLPAVSFAQHPDLSLVFARDAARLERAGVAAWLAMNAGLAPLAGHLSAPFFTYFHGNDFLQPWLPCGPALFERLRRPYLGIVRHALRRAALRRALPRVRHVFTNSRNTARLITERLGVEPGRIGVVAPGVGEDFFQPHESPSGGPLRLLTVARLTRYTARKNVDGVLEAIALLRGKLDLRYTVAGDGDDRPRLERLASALGLAGQVRFAGRVEREELLACYRDADLFVLTPRATANDVEGFGIVYVEAAASGVPVLGSRAGGATDAIEEATNGLLIDDASPAAIAAGIERFAAERERFSPERVRGFAEAFRWPALAEKLGREIAARL